jgi:serine/threonine protein kinase
MSMIGKSLVHYEISAELGKGGMGEVYQAKDTKLGRDVAIKVLPEEFASDSDRVARFQREAKLLASLNHPNIAAIYGLEESDGTHFLVMELIEGDTLRDRIKSGPIPVEEALKLALQMVEALEAAHEKGVIHRDLKPANIKVTPDGKVKILDFGLAKAYVGDQENMSPMDSPTISAAATQQGVILGTAAYMSPEQARGKPVDKRADIWAFGVLLFEMLTGKSLFSGEDVSSTLARVLEREPDFSTLPKKIHPRIQFMVERCLKKDPKDRYSGISDARVDIQEVLSDHKGVFAQPVAAESRLKSQQVLVWASITVMLIIIAGIIVWNLKTKEPPNVSYSEYTLPADQEFKQNQYGSVALTVSPDGSQFVYATTRGLYVRSVDRLDNRPISGSEDNAESPFFSSDGQWVGYYSPADRKLKKIAINGGVPMPLCDIATSLLGAQWRPDNTIVLSLFPGGIFRIPDSGGTPEPLFKTSTAESEESSGSPIIAQILPDGENVLFTNLIDANNKQIVVQSLETGERKTLFPGHGAWYYSTGHIIYAETNGTNIWAVPFDLDRLEVTGGAVPIMEGVIGISLSESGTLAYVLQPSATSQPDTETGSADLAGRTLWWVNREGKEEPLSAKPKNYLFPKLSPDGSKIVLLIEDPNNADIWIWDIVRETMTRLTFFEGRDIQPIWTPDGNRIVFYSAREEGGVYWKNADGTGETEFFGSVPGRVLFPWCFSRDGKTLLNCEYIGAGRMDIGMLSVEGDREHKPLLTGEYIEMQPKISPDGCWIAYTSRESEESEVYVRPFPDVNKGKWQVSTDSGWSPLWSPDGKELFYRCPDGIMAVAVDTEPTFKLGKPKVLFPDTYISLAGGGYEGHPWDIHPDGDRFLMMKQAGAPPLVEAAPRQKIIIVQNWFEELKQRVPVD